MSKSEHKRICIQSECVVRDELKRQILDLRLKQEQMLLQVKNRLPIEIAEGVDSWPRCLTAVAQLKQERNNADVDNAELKRQAEQQQQTIKELAEKLNEAADDIGIALHNEFDEYVAGERIDKYKALAAQHLNTEEGK